MFGRSMARDQFTERTYGNQAARTVSNGWPTKTRHMPPAPPERKSRAKSRSADGACTFAIVWSDFVIGAMSADIAYAV